MAPCWLYCLVVLLFPCASGNENVTILCPLPGGVKAPEEILIAGMIINQEVESFLASIMRIAVDLINQDTCLLPETQLKLTLGSDRASSVRGLEEFLRIQETDNPVGWVGPIYSYVARTLAIASPLSETPLISPTATLADLSDPDTYPYFSRLSPSTSYQGKLLANLVNCYGWDRVATVCATDAYGSSIVEEFMNQAVLHSIQFLSTATFPIASNAPSNDEYLDLIRAAVRKTKASGARIILLACFSDAAADYFTIAMEEGLFGGPYTYLVSDAIFPVGIYDNLDDGTDKDVVDRFREHMRGMIGVSVEGVQPGILADEWVTAWMSADPNEYFGGGDESYPLVPSFALCRDSVYALAWAIDRLIRRGEDPSDGNLLLASIQDETDFYGLTGKIILASNGDRESKYDIWNLQDFSFDLTVVGKGDDRSLEFTKETVFYDGTTNVPDAAERVFVDWGDAEAIVMLTLCSIGLVVTSICLVVMMANRKTPIMRYCSPRFVFGMGIGVLVGFANVFAWTGEPTSGICQLRPWLLMFNFVLIFGHLYAKAFRFLLVMRQRKKLLFRPIPDIQLFLCVFFYLLLFAIPCIVWSAAYPLEVTRSDNSDNDKVNIICDGENAAAIWGSILGLGGLSLLVGVVVAFLNRNYHDFFSEATYIGYTMFTVCITCCIVQPLLFILAESPHAFYLVLMLGIFLGNAAVVVFMFFPKIYVILTPAKNTVPLDEAGSLKTKKNNSSPVI